MPKKEKMCEMKHFRIGLKVSWKNVARFYEDKIARNLSKERETYM